MAVLLVPRNLAVRTVGPDLVVDTEDQDVASQARKTGAGRQVGNRSSLDVDGLGLKGKDGREGSKGRVQAVRGGLLGRVDEGRSV